MSIDQLHRLLHALRAHDQQHRPEDLFLVATHAGFDLIDQCPPNKKTVLASWYLNLPTIHYDLCALLFCTVDVSDHFLLMLASDQRAEVVALVLIGADLETGHCFAHFADQGIGCCITYCV